MTIKYEKYYNKFMKSNELTADVFFKPNKFTTNNANRIYTELISYVQKIYNNDYVSTIIKFDINLCSI